jgi:hypothetical protein
MPVVMTAAMVSAALAEYLHNTKQAMGVLQLASDVTNPTSNTVVFKVASPHGDPLSGTADHTDTVTLTVSVA